VRRIQGPKTMTALRCLDCKTVTPKSGLSVTGPIKEIDADGILSRRWAYVCPHCFGTNLREPNAKSS
jgi:hypothetical protein